ncbi:MAG: hypothetical protein D6730_25260 [Bacteroidetes bacterium]|nr:MAG: hypothetical protein D6730_25260 [Bacteroidota bacterium]
MFACGEGRQQHAPPSRIQRIVQLAADSSALRRYVQLQEGDIQFEQMQWTAVSPAEKGYSYMEIYNVYEAADGSREYYVLEFELDTTQLQARQPITDYQLVVKPDTAFIQLEEQAVFQLEKKLLLQAGGQQFEVYKLLGFRHPQDREAVHYKYWSPEFGTLLIYSGEKETFELTADPHRQEAIPQLIDAIKRDIHP